MDPRQRDYLIRTMIGEANNQGDSGLAAVAHVIVNRTKQGRRYGGSTIKDVVLARKQFEPWSTRRRELLGMSTSSPQYIRAARIADSVLSGQTRDMTGGATHFMNTATVRARRGGSLPKWGRGLGQKIGAHTFYGGQATPIGDLSGGTPHGGMMSAPPVPQPMQSNAMATIDNDRRMSVRNDGPQPPQMSVAPPPPVSTRPDLINSNPHAPTSAGAAENVFTPPPLPNPGQSVSQGRTTTLAAPFGQTQQPGWQMHEGDWRIKWGNGKMTGMG